MSIDETGARRRADELYGHYRFAFAGRPRITRNLAELDEIVRAARALLGEVEAELGSDAAVATEIRERVALYEAERAEIVAAQQLGPTARRAAVLGSRAAALFGVYRRHFAGRNRLTRDLALLDELVDALAEVKAELVTLVSGDPSGNAEAQLATLERNVELYVAERENIVAARNDAGPGDRTGLYAAVANDQFEAYRIHFAGRARLSRRPGLLDRMIATLEWCRSEMRALAAAGEQAETNAKNVQLVEARLEAYRAERAEIDTARRAASVFELIDALGADANLVMDEYGRDFAGQDRSTRDADQLGALLDRLVETERQMWALTRVHDNPANDRNVAVVHDTLAVYAREYDAIREARSN